MDRNSIIGLAIIGLLIVGMGLVNKPAKEAREIEQKRQLTEMRRQDSLARVDRDRAAEAATQQQTSQSSTAISGEATQDEASMQLLNDRFGQFASNAMGEEEKIFLENDELKLTFSTLGGRPYTVNLKQYQTHDSLPLNLFDGDSTIIDIDHVKDRIARTLLLHVTDAGNTLFSTYNNDKSYEYASSELTNYKRRNYASTGYSEIILDREYLKKYRKNNALIFPPHIATSTHKSTNHGGSGTSGSGSGSGGGPQVRPVRRPLRCRQGQHADTGERAEQPQDTGPGQGVSCCKVGT